MRVRVIVNKGGGTVKGSDADDFAGTLAELFRKKGVEASIIMAAGDDLRQAMEEARREAEQARLDAVVVGGGDGTISAAAGVLAGGAVPLGVLPLGTLNHFAKDLGLPLDLEGAVGVIADGAVRAVDVAEVNGRVFVNNSSIGLYADMVADRERQQDDTGRGKWPALAVAGLRVLRRFPLRRLSICGEGWARPCKTPFVFVGNNSYDLSLFNPGGRAALDRGELCLYVLDHRSPWGLLWLGMRAAVGRLDQERDFDRMAVKDVEIRSDAHRLRVSLDGEVEKLSPPLRYRTRPKALRVLAAGD
ncbi:diacylglycerol/lipid kinase family protein [Azospirillum rugosum]|uniref:Diacylglycerol kinase family enzyme n=1 Tax=Azospirillum rugosum TaxID=416170 RepID=A0ABS4SJB3_9PROT|nr:diacylglycerol kinase family protein [Azospirillum rugosum]MBP2292646.1 diacylglycerol kinase family enzyme [Azospirillum rugosum]MDQ0526330.1 diacylglycerol kinase family enzyme [Azospirillum rugosum]